jgi:hypothetical protein
MYPGGDEARQRVEASAMDEGAMYELVYVRELAQRANDRDEKWQEAVLTLMHKQPLPEGIFEIIRYLKQMQPPPGKHVARVG